MQLTPFQKIDIWFDVWRAEAKIKKVDKSVSKGIPITLKRDFYIKTIVKGHREYHKLLAKYIKEHTIK